MQFTGNYADDCAMLETAIGAGKSFDVVARAFEAGQTSCTLYYINGMIQTDSTLKLLGDLLALENGALSAVRDAAQFAEKYISCVETGTTVDVQTSAVAVLSGQAVLLADGVTGAVLADVRSYPERTPDEPENNRVLLGPHEGFNEVLLRNTSMLRRRLRDPALTITLLQIGSRSHLDVAVCSMDGRTDPAMLAAVLDKLRNIRLDTLAMAQETLMECLAPGRRYNPFPRVRYTERPDAAAASVAEGSILLITDNSPAVMVIPSGFFDFLQDTNDFYFPPFLGSFLRLVRLFVFSSTMFLTPVWYLLIRNPAHIPPWLDFIGIEKPIAVPVLVQLLAIELVIDALKLASINTPNSLSSSFSVIGALVLGQFAVEAKWLTAEVVFYMAFVAVANFTQPSFEMGHAYKLARILVLVLTALFNYVGFVAGYAIVFAVLASTKTVVGRGYLYPLIPFNGRKLLRLLFRRSVNRQNS